MMPRWVELYTTSPSGKTLFVCRFCGRTSPTPDKECPVPPTVVSYKLTLPCELLEEIEACVKDAAESVPDDERFSKTPYDITLFSPTQAQVTWVNSRQREKSSYFNIHIEKIEELIELIKLLKTRTEEPSELERKHL